MCCAALSLAAPAPLFAIAFYFTVSDTGEWTVRSQPVRQRDMECDYALGTVTTTGGKSVPLNGSGGGERKRTAERGGTDVDNDEEISMSMNTGTDDGNDDIRPDPLRRAYSDDPNLVPPSSDPHHDKHSEDSNEEESGDYHCGGGHGRQLPQPQPPCPRQATLGRVGSSTVTTAAASGTAAIATAAALSAGRVT